MKLDDKEHGVVYYALELYLSSIAASLEAGRLTKDEVALLERIQVEVEAVRVKFGRRYGK